MNILLIDEITEAVVKAFRTLILLLCEIIYKLIIYCFNVFYDLCHVRLFEDQVDMIFSRITLILGLFMVFRLTFAAIEYIVEPDNMDDKNKGIGNIIKKVFISIVLLGSTNYIFDFAYKFQEKVLDAHVIQKIVLPNLNTTDIANEGTMLSWYIFSAFYKINEEIYDTENVEEVPIIEECTNIVQPTNFNEQGIVQSFFERSGGKLTIAQTCLNEKVETYSGDSVFVIEFEGLFALGTGLIMLWIIISYTIQSGVRIIQLAYLELISPIPIITYLMPQGEEKLKKWSNQCLTTYLDVFIRLAILCFIVSLCSLIASINYKDYIGQVSSSGAISTAYINIIMIIALLIFAKKIPKLIEEIFPSLGGAAGFDYGFGMPKEARQVLGAGLGLATGATVGFLGNGIGRLATSLRNSQGQGIGRRIAGATGAFALGGTGGLLGGAARGLNRGRTGEGHIIRDVAQDRANRNRTNAEIRNGDSTVGGRLNANLRNTLGLESRSAVIGREMQQIGERDDTIYSTTGSINDRLDAMMLDETGNYRNQEAANRYSRLQYYRQHEGERDQVSGQIIDGDMISAAARWYNEARDQARAEIFNNHRNEDQELAQLTRELEIQSRRNVGNYDDVNTIRTETRNQRATNAARRADLAEQQRQAQANEDAVNRGGGGH